MFDTATTLFLLACFGFSFFNLGQAYATIRAIREDNERHTELMRRLRGGR